MNKLINIDSSVLLTEEDIAFTEKVIKCGETEGPKFDSISILMDEIPIFLVSNITMKKLEDTEKKERDSEKPITNIVDYLGLYTRNFKILDTDIRAIAICPERIIRCCDADKRPVLTAKVIIHELAHLKMDMHPDADYGYKDDFFRWMEEPLANLITLQYFDNFVKNTCFKYKSFSNFSEKDNNGVLEFVKSFIEGQPENYKLANELFKYESLKNSWDEWRKNKKSLSIGYIKEKTAYLNYVKENKTIDESFIIDKLKGLGFNL